MGEYADMHIDSTFNDHFDRVHGINKYDSGYDQSMIDEWDIDDMEVPNFTPRLQTKSCWIVKSILKETDKSYLIISEKTDRKYWVSKKMSQIKGKYIFIEKWYAQKLEPVS
jgi:hypothetical protein